MTQSRDELVTLLNEGAAGFGSDLADEMALLSRAERRRQWKGAMHSLEGAIEQVATRMGLGRNEALAAFQVAADAFEARLKTIMTTPGGTA